MANFPGGSAYGMVSQISEGHLLVTDRTFRRFQPHEVDQLAFELEKRLRGLRGEIVPPDDREGIKRRNRRIQRITGVRSMLQAYRMRLRR